MELLASGYVDWNALWKIVVIGLVAGSGLTGVFSIGIVALSWTGFRADVKPHGGSRVAVGWIVTVLCLLIVLGGVAYGIDCMIDK